MWAYHACAKAKCAFSFSSKLNRMSFAIKWSKLSIMFVFCSKAQRITNELSESCSTCFLIASRNTTRWTKLMLYKYTYIFESFLAETVEYKAHLPFAEWKSQISAAEKRIYFTIRLIIITMDACTKWILRSIYTWATFNAKSIIIEKTARCTRIFRAPRWSWPVKKTI